MVSSFQKSKNIKKKEKSRIPVHQAQEPPFMTKGHLQKDVHSCIATMDIFKSICAKFQISSFTPSYVNRKPFECPMYGIHLHFLAEIYCFLFRSRSTTKTAQESRSMHYNRYRSVLSNNTNVIWARQKDIHPPHHRPSVPQDPPPSPALSVSVCQVHLNSVQLVQESEKNKNRQIQQSLAPCRQLSCLRIWWCCVYY